MAYKSILTVSNLSEYNFETQTLLKYFLRTGNFFTKFLSKSLLSVKHTQKIMFPDSQFHVYMIIMQYYNLKNYSLHTQLKGWYIENVLLQMNIETMTASVKISQVISGTVESSERGHNKSYVETLKKM